MRQLARMEPTKLERLTAANNLLKDMEMLLRHYIIFLYEGELKSVKFLDQLFKNMPGQDATPAQNRSKILNRKMP